MRVLLDIVMFSVVENCRKFLGNGIDAEMETRTIIGKWKRKLNKWAYGLDGK